MDRRNFEQFIYSEGKSFFESKDFEVLNTKIEDGYKPEDEVEKHMQADIVILQTPVNWFGAPWIYKKYVDEVFNSGLSNNKFLSNDGRTKENPKKQYGSGGNLLGKKFMVCGTWNAPKEAFGNIDQKLFRGKKNGRFISTYYKQLSFLRLRHFTRL